MEPAAPTPLREPYVGFHFYDESRAGYLGGRDADIAAIEANVRVAALTILYGPSGVGKTSMLRAGVVPRFTRASDDPDEQESGPVVPVYFAEWQHPDFLGLLRSKVIASLAWGEQGPPELEAHTPLDKVITAWGHRSGGAVVLIFDQFEDYLTTTPPDSTQKLPAWTGPGHPQHPPGGDPAAELEHDHFDRVFARLVNRRDVPANVLLSIREDEVFRVDRFRMRIPHLMANSMRIDPLTEAQADEALRRPLAAFNRQARQQDPPSPVVEIPEGDDPIEEVVQQATKAVADRPSDQRIEPAFLQVAMQELWNREAASWTATPNCPRQLRKSVLVGPLGGVKAIIDQYVDKNLGSTLSRRELSIASRAFRQLISPRGEKIPMFASQLAPRLEPWLSWHRLRRWLMLGRADAGDQQPLSRRGAAALAKLERVKILRKIPPDRYDIYHQVLARPLKDWSHRFETRRVGRYLAYTGTLIVVALMWLVIRDVRREQNDRFLEAYESVPAEDPGLALTLAAHAYRIKPTPGTRARIARVLESTDGWLVDHKGQVTGVDFSADGRTLASAGADAQALLWNTATYRVKARIKHARAVNAAVFRPNSTELVTVSDDRTIRVWNLPWLEETETSEGAVREALFLYDFSAPGTPAAHTDEVWTAAFSRDGKYLVTGGQDKTAKIWDMQRRTFVRDFPTTYEIVTSAFSPDGVHAAVAGLNATIEILNITTGERASFQGHSDYVYGLSYTADGSRLASSSWDGSVVVWNIEKRESERTLSSPGRLWGLVMNGDGTMIAATNRDGSLLTWDAQSAQAVTEFSGEADALTAIAGSAEFDLIAAGSLRGPIRLFRIRPRVLVDGQISAVSFSKDAGRLVAATSVRADAPVAAPPGQSPRAASAVLWDAATPRRHTALRPPSKGDEIRSVASDGAGEKFMTGSRNGEVLVWSRDGSTTDTLRAGGAEGANVQAVAISPDGQRLAAGDWNGNVTVWAQQGQGYAVVDQLTVPSKSRVSALAFSPDGGRLAIGWGNDRSRVQVRTLSSRSAVNLNVKGRTNVLRLAFSPRGDQLAAGFEDSALIAWSLSAGSDPIEPRLVKDDHDGAVTAVDFDPQGLRLASGSRDKTSRVWILKSGELEVSTPAQEAVVGVKFVGDARLLLIDTTGNIKTHDLNWDRLAKIASGRGRPVVEKDCAPLSALPCPYGLLGPSQTARTMWR